MAKKQRSDTQAEQSRRFVETARKLGVDESDESILDRALRKVAKPKRRKDDNDKKDDDGQ